MNFGRADCTFLLATKGSGLCPVTADYLRLEVERYYHIFHLDNPNNQLHSTIQFFQSTITPGVFSLSWKDEEGDDIVVSSNGELQAALEECPGAPNSTLKMNVIGWEVTWSRVYSLA